MLMQGILVSEFITSVNIISIIKLLILIPVIKEWSILAIRNLCEDNNENQEMIRNLTKVGDAENPLLKEFGLDTTGTLRIKKPNN